MRRIKEISHYKVEDEEGNTIKSGFKDLEDSYEYAVNYLLKNPEIEKVVIRGEIIIKAKR